jgi:hypothetical protein
MQLSQLDPIYRLVQILSHSRTLVYWFIKHIKTFQQVFRHLFGFLYSHYGAIVLASLCHPMLEITMLWSQLDQL